MLIYHESEERQRFLNKFSLKNSIKLNVINDVNMENINGKNLFIITEKISKQKFRCLDNFRNQLGITDVGCAMTCSTQNVGSA